MPRAPRPRAAKASGPASTGYTPTQISRHISAYFSATPPAAWSLEAFTAHCRTHAHFAAKKTPAMVNYWLTELKNILSAEESEEGEGENEGERERDGERRERARAVQEEWKGRGRKKHPRYTATNSIVVHGDIINSSVANIAGTLPAPAASPAPPVEPEPVAEPAAEPAAEPEPDTDDDRLPTLIPTDITTPGTFLSRFPAMTHKARITAVKTLEDTLHTHLQQAPASSVLLTHGIIDRDDAEAAALFTTAEMRAISALAPRPPEQDAAFEYACARYTGGRGDAEWYRVVSETPPRPAGVRYERGVNFNATYVNHAVGAILGNMEHLAETCSFAPEPNEGWFDANIWAPLIDYCFKDLHGVSLSRKEIMSRAAPHFRFDGILLQHQSGQGAREYGAIEVGRNTLGTKRHTDKLKLVHILHAMLHRLAAEVGGRWEVARGLETVGVHCVGSSVQILRMGFVSRNVCLLRTGPVHPVPSRFEDMEDVFPAMRAVVAAKLVIKRSIEIVKGYEHEGWADDI
ncbi:uncharacterized protein LAJ45_11463 [Morchella importuna]|uniref:uncharacterized protein n=1 Tax=Morchella importuna TaxID=1174673 RepID=UPI001E8E529F|nr:uncharacterized protein LAJ45_11463 [Morchella importuna]KAH8144523.1 hypothetical protein LAJ45_11463 [Morchella importuna]